MAYSRLKVSSFGVAGLPPTLGASLLWTSLPHWSPPPQVTLRGLVFQLMYLFIFGMMMLWVIALPSRSFQDSRPPPSQGSAPSYCGISPPLHSLQTSLRVSPSAWELWYLLFYYYFFYHFPFLLGRFMFCPWAYPMDFSLRADPFVFLLEHFPPDVLTASTSLSSLYLWFKCQC